MCINTHYKGTWANYTILTCPRGYFFSVNTEWKSNMGQNILVWWILVRRKVASVCSSFQCLIEFKVYGVFLKNTVLIYLPLVNPKFRPSRSCYKRDAAEIFALPYWSCFLFHLWSSIVWYFCVWVLQRVPWASWGLSVWQSHFDQLCTSWVT